MRAAWVRFAAGGDPWPAFNGAERVMSLVPPQPQVWTGFSDAHHCSFWSGNGRATSKL
jgi:para-nitrobenzyl esterase